MKRAFKIVVSVLIILAVIALTILYISTHNIAVFNPKGMIAIKERELIITAFLLMLIVVIPVILMSFAFAWRYRKSNDKATYRPDWGHNNLAEIIWWGVPLCIIIVLAIITYRTTHELNPFKPIVATKKAMPIQVVALQWKWLFIYPDQGIATVNYIRIPKDTPINFEITADAPMNSFWVPQLGGQIYAMPAMRTKLHLIANEYGTFRGQSANLSGKGFAGMVFDVESTSDEEFDSWVDSVKSDSPVFGIEQYKYLAEPSEYNPRTYYVLTQPDLFDRIVMKYSSPEQMRELSLEKGK